MKSAALICVCFVLFSASARTHSQAIAAREKLLLEKDISQYAKSDMILTVRELEFPPDFKGTKHRHPGPVVVCVLEGSLEVSLEGQPPKTYDQGQCFSEEPRQLHLYSRNVSKTDPVRIISYILSRNGAQGVLGCRKWGCLRRRSNYDDTGSAGSVVVLV